MSVSIFTFNPPAINPNARILLRVTLPEKRSSKVLLYTKEE